MTRTQRNGLGALGWLHRHLGAVLSAVFAAGLAYSQLSHLDAQLREAMLEIKELRRDVTAIRIAGVGLPEQAFRSFVDAQGALERQARARHDALNDRVVRLRADVLALSAQVHAAAPRRVEP